MKLNAALSGATAPFAHLLGLSAKRIEDAPDDEKDKNKDKDRTKRAGETDEEYAARMKKIDDDEAARKAEDDKEKEKAEGDKDDEEMSGATPAAAARRRERARCAAIFGAASAGARPDVAAHLAFNTDLSRSAAIALLDSVAAGVTPAPAQTGRSRLDARMADVRKDTPNPGADGPGAAAPGSAEELVAKATAAYNRALGKK